MGAITTVLDQEREDVLVLAAGMGREHASKLFKDSSPGLDLDLGVIDVRNGLATNPE